MKYTLLAVCISYSNTETQILPLERAVTSRKTFHCFKNSIPDHLFCCYFLNFLEQQLNILKIKAIIFLLNSLLFLINSTWNFWKPQDTALAGKKISQRMNTFSWLQKQMTKNQCGNTVVQQNQSSPNLIKFYGWIKTFSKLAFPHALRQIQVTTKKIGCFINLPQSNIDNLWVTLTNARRKRHLKDIFGLVDSRYFTSVTLVTSTSLGSLLRHLFKNIQYLWKRIHSLRRN